jgi:hypothetical protein
MIQKSLIPGVHQFVGLSYGATPEEHKPLYEILKSNRSFEEEVYVSGMGGALTKNEGSAVQFDDIQETYTSRYRHDTIAIGFAVTKEAFDDDQYGTIARAKAQELGRSMADTKQVKAAATFNSAFDASVTGGDGVSLINSAHPTTVGTFSNTAGAVDLTETALENACIAISKLTNDRGILLSLRPVSLHIPTDLQFVAEKILGSTLTTNALLDAAGTENVSNANDINAVKSMGKFRGGVHVNHRFTNDNDWFIKTTAMNGTKMFVRESLGGDSDVDFLTDNMLFKFRERYSFGWTDPRCWYAGSGV